VTLESGKPGNPCAGAKVGQQPAGFFWQAGGKQQRIHAAAIAPRFWLQHGKPAVKKRVTGCLRDWSVSSTSISGFAGKRHGQLFNHHL
jgi:hypothetical protein